MKHLITPILLVITLAMGASIASAQSYEGVVGGNAFVPEVLSQSPLPDGSVLVTVLSRGFTWTNDTDIQAGNGSMDCYGTNVVSAEGEPVSGAGSCTAIDEDGDAWTAWWTGTAGGEWGFLNGTGKYAGISGGGTWEAAAEYADGKSTNSWIGSWTIPEMEMDSMME